MGQRLNPFGVLQVVHLVSQDLSIAGKRAGLAGARSGLFMEQVRIVKEMREADKRNGRTGDMVRPRYLVWENVVGAFSSNKGKDFAAVLEEIIKIVEPQAPGIEVPEKGWPTWGGYHDEVGGRWSVVWRTHDAQHWGVPQRRRRISVVADFGGDTASEIQFDGESVSGDIAESGASGEGPAEAAESGFNPAVARNLTARADGSPCADRGPNIVCSPHQGGCDGGGKGALVQTEKSGTLGTGNDQTIFCMATQQGGAELRTGGNQVPLTYQDVTGTLSPGAHAGSYNGQDAYNDMLVCGATPDVAHTLRAKANCAYREDAETYPVQNMVVRRLTPLECERLQGFPDGWTDIGDWVKTDKRGREIKVKGSADSPRYKALGNSIALPFWDWMLRRMARYLPEGATLGSLFDGIGGFPLCFERIHGKGTARWASEIEPFPIAVTKRWFGEE
jgi:DNA (cytosine-5)-methyltransferase 1|nr:MAG TPA: Cytosine specific methyltransferase [Caudoviricetes sp.]